MQVSLARQLQLLAQPDSIYHGADDNALGVASLLQTYFRTSDEITKNFGFEA